MRWGPMRARGEDPNRSHPAFSPASPDPAFFTTQASHHLQHFARPHIQIGIFSPERVNHAGHLQAHNDFISPRFLILPVSALHCSKGAGTLAGPLAFGRDGRSVSLTARRSSQPMHNQRDGAGTRAASIFWWMDGMQDNQPPGRHLLKIECIHSGEGGLQTATRRLGIRSGQGRGVGPRQPHPCRPTAGGPCRRPREAPSGGWRIEARLTSQRSSTTSRLFFFPTRHIGGFALDFFTRWSPPGRGETDGALLKPPQIGV